MAGMEVYRRILKENKIKVTKQRMMIIEVLKNSGCYMKVEEIYERLLEYYEDFGLATVYRTIITLTKLGIVNKIQFDDAIARYELNDIDENNTPINKICIYKICDKCGKIEIADIKNIDRIINEIRIDLGDSVSKYDFKLYKTCDDCKS